MAVIVQICKFWNPLDPRPCLDPNPDVELINKAQNIN